MKRTIQFISLLLIILATGGCAQKKNLFSKPKVTRQDFYYATIDSLQKWDALILNENTSMQVQTLEDLWLSASSENRDWVIKKEKKILILSDDSNNKEIGMIDYFNSDYSTINTLGTMNMLLYTFDENGKIKHRKVAEHEIIQTRLNDSINRIRLSFEENVAGKILVQQYENLIPAIEAKFQQMGANLPLLNVPSYIFQDTVPIISGKCEVLVPKYRVYDSDFELINEFIQLGNGEMKIEDEKTKGFYYLYYNASRGNPDFNKKYPREREELQAGWWKDTRLTSSEKELKQKMKVKYDALKVTATVSNVMPLPKGSVEQPLGIQILRNLIEK